VAISLFWLVHPWYDPTNDGSMYVATARSIARGEGYTLLGSPFLIRPPGFSILLAPLFALLGTDFLVLNAFVSAFGAVGVVLLFLWARPRLGKGLALLVAVAIWLNPGYRELSNQVMSDVPGTALLLGCLLLERRFARAPSARGSLLLGLAIGLSSLVRSVNALLLPAILGAALTRRLLGEREAWRAVWLRQLCLAGGFALAVVPWSVRNDLVAPPPPAEQTLLYSYSSGMWHEDMGDPRSPRLGLGDVLARFPERSSQVASVLGSRMKEGPQAPPRVGVTLLLVACALFVLAKRRASPELFVLLTLAVVSFYFGFAGRLLLPVWVLALPAAVETARDLGRFALGERRARVVTGALLVALIAVDFEPRRDWDEIEREHEVLRELCDAMEANLEPDARLASARGWHYAVHMDRPVYSLEFVLQREGNMRAVEELIDRVGVNTVILSPVPPAPLFRDRDVLPYFSERYRPLRRDRALVFRVRP
jgi:4-amino-4-deoxy-L-arabinose transferase-like glycosyltransferase